jgi:hypothetical protein
MVRSLKRSTRRALAIPVALATLLLAPHARAQQEVPPLPPPPPPAAPPAAPAPAPAPPPPAGAPYYAPPPPPPPPGGPYYAPPSPPGPPGVAPAPGRLEQVRFEPDDPDLALMVRTGEVPFRHVQRFRHVWYYERGFAPVYSPACEGPCTTELAAGTYHLALSKDGGRAVPAGGAVVNGPSTIHATYDDRRGIRIVGGIVLVGGIIGGVVMIVASVTGQSQTCDGYGDCTTQVNAPLLVGGIGVVVASAVVGTILASQRDSAHIMVTPLTMPTVGALKESPMAAIGAAPAQGAALTVRF